MLDALMILLIMVVNVSLVTILLRINTKHKELFAQGETDGAVLGPVTRLARLMEFIMKRKFAELNDPLLALSCIVFIGSFLVAFPLMFLMMLLPK